MSLGARMAALSLLVACPALAQPGDPAAAPDPGPEARKQMAAVHQRMADCLRSDRPMAECRSEMMTSCRSMMDESDCPMMGSRRQGMGPGGMGPGMMRPGTKEGTPPAPEE
jgi:hypothetical protein